MHSTGKHKNPCELCNVPRLALDSPPGKYNKRFIHKTIIPGPTLGLHQRLIKTFTLNCRMTMHLENNFVLFVYNISKIFNLSNAAMIYQVISVDVSRIIVFFRCFHIADSIRFNVLVSDPIETLSKDETGVHKKGIMKWISPYDLYYTCLVND